LKPELQDVARSYANRTHSRFSLRSFFAYEQLVNKIDRHTAVRLVFGEEAPAINEAIAITEQFYNDREPLEVEPLEVQTIEATSTESE
jgi:hypothetical protein